MEDPLDWMHSPLIKQINHRNPRSSSPAQGSLFPSVGQERGLFPILLRVQQMRAAPMSVLGWGEPWQSCSCSAGTGLRKWLGVCSPGKGGRGTFLPFPPSLGCGREGKDLSSWCGVSPRAQPLGPHLVLPWGWLNFCACLSLLVLPDPGAVTSCSQWLCGCLWMVFVFWAQVSSCLIGDQVMKNCSAASCRPWGDPGQQQEHPCRTCIFGWSASLRRRNAEGTVFPKERPVKSSLVPVARGWFSRRAAVGCSPCISWHRTTQTALGPCREHKR